MTLAGSTDAGARRRSPEKILMKLYEILSIGFVLATAGVTTLAPRCTTPDASEMSISL